MALGSPSSGTICFVSSLPVFPGAPQPGRAGVLMTSQLTAAGTRTGRPALPHLSVWPSARGRACLESDPLGRLGQEDREGGGRPPPLSKTPRENETGSGGAAGTSWERTCLAGWGGVSQQDKATVDAASSLGPRGGHQLPCPALLWGSEVAPGPGGLLAAIQSPAGGTNRVLAASPGGRPARSPSPALPAWPRCEKSPTLVDPLGKRPRFQKRCVSSLVARDTL